MKKILCLSFVLALAAGCDHKPAPVGSRDAMTAPAPPTPTPPPPAVDSPPPPPPPQAVDAGVAVAPSDAAPAPEPVVQVTDECVAIGDKIAGIIIAGTQDPTTKTAIEQDRARFVRRIAEACTTSPWTPEAKTCFNTAKTPDEVQLCGAKLSGQ